MLFLIILYIIVLRKFLKVLAVLFILIVSSGVVCAQDNASDVLADDYNQILADSNNDVLGEPLKTFTNLKNDISGAVDVFEVTSDYKFDNATDNKNGILINTTSLVINGNGHTIDASNQARIFLINASQLVINDLTFINANITEGSALLMVNSNVTTNNVVFKNSVANNGVISASGTKYLSNNDVFKDVTSTKNGGAIFIDKVKESYILNSSFTNCTSGFGGAILALSSSVDIENSTFVENGAVFDGGAVYVSWCNLTILNSTFTKTVPLENNDCYGAVLYCDHSSAVVNNTKIIDNIGYDTGVLYFYDSEFAVVNSTFKDNINFDGKFDDIFSVFDLNDAVLINNTFSGEGSVSLKNTDYNTIVDLPGAKITLINNSIVVDTLPAKFDSRDWGWITPVKDQAQLVFAGHLVQLVQWKLQS